MSLVIRVVIFCVRLSAGYLTEFKSDAYFPNYVIRISVVFEVWVLLNVVQYLARQTVLQYYLVQCVLK